ncbi:hypothetical protein [Nitrosomonas sp.]|uniref:hypothetical protein n=1 Tax=Nitrosomonas sp. TaxID=42353 RepID=UPI0025FBD9A7|nr:hypothetical protein [Nitrosomonas sp.]MBY0483230.1 hypothetical protein [Nitrosomonas sp.]
MEHKTKRMGTFTIPITIPVVLMLAGIILVSAFYFYTEFRPLISFVGAVAGGCAAIYTAYYIGLTLKLQVQDNKIKNSITLVNTIFTVLN